jgi:DMSO/TMAO reductase YedYZ molybdopterin-dependent catalytic subunit
MGSVRPDPGRGDRVRPMPDDPIISPDVRRPDRLPPGHRETFVLPVEHLGDVPPFDPATWDLAVFPVPLVDRVVRFTWGQFQAFPRVHVFADFHSDNRLTKLDNLWDGVPTRALLAHVTPSPEVTHVMVHGEYGYAANLPLADFFAEDAVFAVGWNGEPLTAEHGRPVRLVVPRLLGRKSVKWVRGVEFLAADRPGFWEARGDARPADPWA